MEPRSVLAIGAHPSDVEFFAGAAIAAFARQGALVTLVVCTDGSRGFGGETDLVAERRKETERAAEALGAGEVVMLGHPEGELVADDRLRRELTREIRRHRPELVLGHDPTTHWRKVGELVRLGHADHRAAGAATLDAIHPCAESRSYYPELVAQGLPPWIVRELWLFDTAEPNHFFDVSGGEESKRSALANHATQLPRRLVEEAEALAESGRELWGVTSEQFRRLNLL